ncbi:MAG: sugar-binding domain-containing protein [Prolixibacteraceae bacterium]
MKLFDLNWKFNYGNNILASNIDFNDQNWKNIDLPHDCSKNEELRRTIDSQSDSISTEIGWYRKHFEIPQDWLDKIILIDFEGISEHNEIFVNGTSIFNSKNGNSSFQAVLNPYLNSERNNIIAIRVAIPKQTDVNIHVESGIYKHVWLVIKDSSDSRNK